MKAPKVRPHISLGQRPRIWERKDHSPVGAGNFRAASPEMGRPYRANSSVIRSPGALPQANMVPRRWRFHEVRFAHGVR